MANSTEQPNYQTESVHGKSILFNADANKRTGIKLPDSIAANKKDFTLNLWIRPESLPTNWGEIVCGSGDNPWNKQLMIYISPNAANVKKINLQGTDGAGGTDFDIETSKWAMLTWVNTSEGKAEFYHQWCKTNS